MSIRIILYSHLRFEMQGKKGFSFFRDLRSVAVRTSIPDRPSSDRINHIPDKLNVVFIEGRVGSIQKYIRKKNLKEDTNGKNA